eukprot:1948401-Prymnesium_polylepis.1
MAQERTEKINLFVSTRSQVVGRPGRRGGYAFDCQPLPIPKSGLPTNYCLLRRPMEEMGLTGRSTYGHPISTRSATRSKG